MPKENITLERQNKFKVLQEEEIEMGEKEDNEEETMENLKESGKQVSGQKETEHGEAEEKGEQTNEQIQMKIDPQKDKEGEEERIMRKLLLEWRLLDERFVPEEQKQIYKEAFQKYKEKVGERVANKLEKIEIQGNQNMGMSNSGKGGRKRGRRLMIETIQEVGEMLVNSGRVIPLSEAFQLPPKLLK